MDRTHLRFSGWGLVLVAAVAMGTAGIYQFGWSSIRLPIGTRLGVPEPALGTAFTLFVIAQTLGQLPAGWVRDRYGPKLPMGVAAVFLAAGLTGVAYANSLLGIYFSYCIGGLGVSITYTVTINTPVKWFEDRRGLATGVVTMAYSGVSFLVIPGIRTGTAANFSLTLLLLAALTGGASLVGAVLLKDPPAAQPTDTGTVEVTDGHTFGWRETIRTWQFWLLYGVFVAVNGVGLMVMGKVVAFATALSLPSVAGTASASLVALADASGVLAGGSLSDRFGPRRTVATSLALCGVCLAGAIGAGMAGVTVGFVALIGAAAFFRSPPFAVFPTIVGDYYGRAYSSENYAALYSAKLFGGILGGTVASSLIVVIGWAGSFGIGAGLIFAAGVAFLFLRPVNTPAPTNR